MTSPTDTGGTAPDSSLVLRMAGRFEQLFLAVCNAEFACGEHDGSREDEDESYDQLCRTAGVAERALRAHYFELVNALSQSQERVRALEVALRRIAIRPRGHHNCDDYSRGYGQAQADLATIAEAALTPTAGEKS